MARSGAFIFGASGTVLTPEEVTLYRDAQPWGFILFTRNIETAEQTRRLTADMRNAVGWNAPVFIDQEGGRVQRFGPPMGTQYLPALDQAEGASNRAKAMYLRSRLIAAELQALGIDGNCAPLADIATAETHPVLKNRCYGYSVDDVVLSARAVAEGQVAGGVLPVLKHIPGHGRAQLDSHHELPTVTTSENELVETDFAAFKALADLPLGMTAHVLFSALDSDRPATTSQIMHRIIRDEIGFDGLLMTDDISMNALAGNVVERSLAASQAGCDLVLHCNGDFAEMVAIATAIGPLSDAGQRRADHALTYRRDADDVDIAALTADLAALMQQGCHDG